METIKEILALFFNAGTTVKPGIALLNMLVAAGLSTIVYFVYKITFSGVAYSKKFNITLVMLSLITTIVMNILGNSLALSMGMVGALSIVRFRTAIKDPRDTAYIFWAITIGLGCGSGNYFMVGAGTLVVSAVTILLSKNLKNDDSYLLIVRCSKDAAASVRRETEKLYETHKLRGETITGDYTELVYQIKLKKGKANGYTNQKIKDIDGVFTVNMVARSGETLG
ncbi:MAG TPA: DUF4956 domain-containing protein [Candidatus Atribacteria bacterium]|nr:DUF4956 domain-containing protein [Candidatus Atribacteria bacterium]HPT79360.1 DUF4956 domain-containing protein [Candidatus Atribacteria bacterium]